MSGFRIWGLWALGFEAWGFAACIGVQGLRFEELLFRVEGWEFSAFGFRASECRVHLDSARVYGCRFGLRAEELDRPWFGVYFGIKVWGLGLN